MSNDTIRFSALASDAKSIPRAGQYAAILPSKADKRGIKKVQVAVKVKMVRER
jgi:hypothetical protein